MTDDLHNVRYDRDLKVQGCSNAEYEVIEKLYKEKREKILEDSYLIEDYVEQQIALRKGKHVQDLI